MHTCEIILLVIDYTKTFVAFYVFNKQYLAFDMKPTSFYLP